MKISILTIFLLSRLLPFFMAQFTSAGGRVERGRLASLTSAELTSYDVLVNCTGLGARDLAGDETIQPLRGESCVEMCNNLSDKGN